ncbi:MAG: serine--tRNA ligase, partial [Chloroflexota bacterium]
MLDLKYIRENPQIIRQALANRHDSAPLDEIIRLDSERREKLTALDELRHARKEASKTRQESGEGRALRDRIKALEELGKNLDEQVGALLLHVPNMPQPSVPVGSGEADNVLVRSWGEPKSFSFTPAPHWQLGEALNIIDFSRGVKISGSRFYVLKGQGAKLQRALINF